MSRLPSRGTVPWRAALVVADKTPDPTLLGQRRQRPGGQRPIQRGHEAPQEILKTGRLTDLAGWGRNHVVRSEDVPAALFQPGSLRLSHAAREDRLAFPFHLPFAPHRDRTTLSRTLPKSARSSRMAFA